MATLLRSGSWRRQRKSTGAVAIVSVIGLSDNGDERRACAALKIHRSMCQYRSRRPNQVTLKTRIKEICETRIRYGYRRVRVQLLREGRAINHKKVHLVYKELELHLRNKKPKRRVKAKLREDREEAASPNEVWAMDFVHDQLATGRKLRVLTVVDTWSRYAPIVDPRFSYRGEDAVRALDEVCQHVGYPRTIRVNQGTEFVSRDPDLRAYQRGVTLDYSRPGKPSERALCAIGSSTMASFAKSV